MSRLTGISILTLMISFLFSLPALYAIEGWRVISKAAWSDDFNDVAFPEKDNIWIVGNDGRIVHSNDGGTIWEDIMIETGSKDLEDCYFLNSNEGWIVGESGVIIKTVDGGNIWKLQNSTISNSLYGVYFVNSSTGWVVGSNGTILRTSNGGKTWNVQAAGTTNTLTSVFFLNENEGFIADASYYGGYKGRIYHTTDGGNSWEPILISGRYFRDIFFSDPLHGWVVGSYGSVAYTNDGGVTWTAQSSGFSSYSDDFYKVCFVDSMKGMVVGYYSSSTPRAIYTENGGQTWINISNTFTGALYGISFDDDQNGIAVGQSGKIFGTTDSGLSWTSRNYGTNDDLHSVCFADTLVGWAAGYGSSGYSNIMKTTDGGETWFSQYSTSSSYYLRGVYCTDPLTAWVVGDDGRVFHTTDGGQSWLTQISETPRDLNYVIFVNPLNGWFCGEYGTIRFTTNQGTFWSEGNTPDETLGSTDFYDIHFIDKKNGWIVGETAKIFHTTDGGGFWEEQTSGYTYYNDYLYDVFFIDSTHGCAVGNSGKIVTTTDAGVNWIKQNSGTSQDLSGVHFINKSEGWAVGEGGKIIYTGDGGVTWKTEYSRTQQYLYHVFFIDANHGWAVGSNGTILKYEGGGRYWADIDDNGKVNVVDIQLVANRWGYSMGDRGYNELCDVNDQGLGDGTIDIVDIQLVASQWGWPDIQPGLFKTTSEGTVIVDLIPAGSDSYGNEVYQVYVENVRDLAGYELKLRFNPLLDKKIQVDNSSLLTQQNNRTVLTLTPDESVSGSVKFGAFSFGEHSGAAVSGVLAEIRIRKESMISSELELANITLVNSRGEKISSDLQTGELPNNNNTVPLNFSLSQNYPNPFNPATVIHYSLATPSHVTVTIFNINGETVTTLLNKFQQAGNHSIVWNAKDQNGNSVTSGVYVYRLTTNDYTKQMKMTLIR